MIKVEYDIVLKEFAFECTLCGAENFFGRIDLVPNYCVFCNVKLTPRVSELLSSVLYRTLYHFDNSKELEKKYVVH